MIIKYFDLQKELKNINYYLLYGPNTGLIEEIIDKTLKPFFSKNLYYRDEKEILANEDEFKESILNKSFFEKDKLIIINRASDKILSIIEEIIDKKPEELKIILKSENLEKKSKLRNFFEKKKNTIITPFYEDNYQTLISLAQNFIREKKIKISSQNINLIIERSKGNRINLKNELLKIENLLITRKNIKFEDLLNITNLAENHSHSELVDNSLIGNKKKTLNIINENNFSSEDCVLILRIFLQKLKRLLKLKNQNRGIQNIDKTISSFKPPIFWKEKETVKKQIEIWETNKIENLISETCDTEFTVKKNPNISVKILTNFILDRISVQ